MNHLDNIIEQNWDFVVIGTGIGGATAGYALAKVGKKVLFLEKGRAQNNYPDTIKGRYPETRGSNSLLSSLKRSGRFFDSVQNAKRNFIPLMGCGTGGSSALYGMAMERLSKNDFNSEGTAPGICWPLQYCDMVKWYQEAEKLYRVKGGRDPLRSDIVALPDSPELTPQSKELYDHFKSKGLHPYKLPLACERLPNCTCCQGYLCPKECKNDSDRICLRPAIEEYGARLIDQCDVIRLESDLKKVTGVVCKTAEKTFIIKAENVILAAGALNTPALLLKSSSKDWPQGLANRSGMVGRHLMRHYIDLYLIFTRTGGSHPFKEIALNDLYNNEFGKFGTFQSFGELPPERILVDDMYKDVISTSAWFGPFFKIIQPILIFILSFILKRSVLMAAIMEDSGDISNHVFIEPTLGIKYKQSRFDFDRLKLFRDQIRKIIKPYFYIKIFRAHRNDMLAHICGTCRFGTDPTTSVLNAYNRAHDVKNLYIVDSSFFPTSGGTNPSLTIAANALRVAQYISNEIKR